MGDLVKCPDIWDAVDALTERVAVLERRQAQERHIHNSRYSKSVSRGLARDHEAAFWSWTCMDPITGEMSKDCPEASGGTNMPNALPEGFPESLR